MGADMLLGSIISLGNEIDAEKAKAQIEKIVRAETNHERLAEAAEFLGIEDRSDALADIVAEATGLISSTRREIIQQYQSMAEEVAYSVNSREVTGWRFGEATIYFTGGMSWGDDPTEVFGLWYRALDDEENPYRHELKKSLGLASSYQAEALEAGLPLARLIIEPATTESAFADK